MVAIVEAGAESDLPRAAPAATFVTAGIQRDLGGLGEIRRGERADLAAGMQGEELADVAVVVMQIVHVFLPFLELSEAADLRSEQPGAPLGDALAQLGIDVRARRRHR